MNKGKLMDMIKGKSPNKLSVTEGAYMMHMRMPNKHLYITSLGGPNREGRRSLLRSLLKKPAPRYYTHAKKAWDTGLFEEEGFKKTKKGNIKDEVVPFDAKYIAKLWIYERY